jgi:hypothetical protein
MKSMARAIIPLALVVALALAAEAWSAGSRVSVNSRWSTFVAQFDAVPSAKLTAPVYHLTSHAHRPHHHLYPGFVSGSGIIVAPYLPYFAAPVVVVNAPYFCLLHRTGFVSRIGMLDHLAGNHKLPFRAASAICPEGADQCLLPSY